MEFTINKSAPPECAEGALVPVGVLLRKEEEGVMGGVTGGVRFPLLWRGGVETLLRHRPPVRVSDSLGCTFFFTASCSRRAASVMNLRRPTSPFFLSFVVPAAVQRSLPHWNNYSEFLPLEKTGEFMLDCKIFGELYYKNVNVDKAKIKVELAN